LGLQEKHAKGENGATQLDVEILYERCLIGQYIHAKLSEYGIVIFCVVDLKLFVLDPDPIAKKVRIRPFSSSIPNEFKCL
jgi:hypothetical protein